MKLRVSLALFLAFLIGLANPSASVASAGYYPTYKGEVLRVEACLPIGTVFPLKLQLASTDAKWRTVATIAVKKKTKGTCDKGFSRMIYGWKVNVSTGGALRIWDSTTKKGFYVWPDGIEIQ
ncbi:MAG: hypothetical protein F2851_03470 [Actinobacteria bacterium]|uniref:Unannotated protein n=1 Tax=freshwater metagenome TaxID=449393 RepID=A0A6J5Z7M0_9ZZZZ|nr:hypothetical protein [Actinomycetota bacterium]